MTGLEITLIVVGIILIAGSFFVSEKLSASDIEDIRKLSEKEIKVILEKQLQEAQSHIEDALEEKLNNSVDDLETKSDQETNEKIMAISEYSDTVLDSMNKSHNEVMFMYSMLGEKQDSLTEMTKEMQQMESSLIVLKEEVNGAIEELQEKTMLSDRLKMNESLTIQADETMYVPVKKTTIQEELKEHMNEQNEFGEEFAEEKNVNQQILELHQQGKTQVEIAKQLGRGLGEVKLVLGLFEGEE